MSSKHKAPANQKSLPTFISQLCGLIDSARGQAIRAELEKEQLWLSEQKEVREKDAL
jgi:hypothetical protein